MLLTNETHMVELDPSLLSGEQKFIVKVITLIGKFANHLDETAKNVSLRSYKIIG